MIASIHPPLMRDIEGSEQALKLSDRPQFLVVVACVDPDARHPLIRDGFDPVAQIRCVVGTDGGGMKANRPE